MHCFCGMCAHVGARESVRGFILLYVDGDTLITPATAMLDRLTTMLYTVVCKPSIWNTSALLTVLFITLLAWRSRTQPMIHPQAPRASRPIAPHL